MSDTITTEQKSSTCPDWCTEDTVDTDGVSVLHYTPPFGPFYGTKGVEITGHVFEPLSFTTGEGLGDLGVDDLRQLAADALAAAEWLAGVEAEQVQA